MTNFNYRQWFGSVHKLGRVVVRAFRDAWPDNRWLIIKMAILSVLTASVSYGVYWLYSQAIGVLATSERSAALWFLVGALIVSFVAAALEQTRSLGERQFWHRLQNRMYLLFYGKKAGLGIDQLEDSAFRDLVTKAQERSIWPIMNILESQFLNLNNLVRLTVALVIVAAYDWRLCFLVAIALIPQFIVDVKHGHTLWDIYGAETEIRRQHIEWTRHFSHRIFLAELKLFQNVEYFLAKIRGLMEEFRLAQETAEQKRYRYALGATALSALLIGAVMVIIIRRVIDGGMPLSGFVFIWSSVGSLHQTLSALLQGIAKQNEWALYATDLYQVMDAEPEAARLTGTIPAPAEAPEIVFDQVSFAYPASVIETPILDQVSFTIKAGERLALVGINGAGKSTLIKLLCGIYQPTSGRILVDGIDLRELDIHSWRRRLAVLSQNYAIYHALVEEVIGLGDTSVPLEEERMKNSALAGGVDSFVNELKAGYKTRIGKEFKDGHELSGGQNQRLALSRVFYRQAKVVILDEPTASLDALAEAEIFERIAAWPREQSIILITHRFSTIRNADHIVVLSGGRVIAEGTHPELMDQGGLYAEMFRKQARGYGLEPAAEQV